jgi:hypothetical protein
LESSSFPVAEFGNLAKSTEPDVPIIFTGWGRLQIEFPRCASNRYE